MRKKRNKNRGLTSPILNKRAITVILFGVVGAYLVFVANATYPYPPPGYPTGLEPGSSAIFDDPNERQQIHPAGSIFSVNYYINIPAASDMPSEQIHVNLFYIYEKSDVEYVANSLECGSFAPCIAVPGLWSNHSAEEMATWSIGNPFNICFEMPPSMYGASNVFLFRLKLKQIQSSGVNDAYTRYRWFTGACNPSQFEADTLGEGQAVNPAFWTYGRAGDGAGIGGPGAVSDNPGGNTSDDTDSGTSGQGTGPGGGGGGSSATTQSNQPNSLPSSSDQGTAQQPKIEPSPFFDGKLFAAGSDPYDSANTVSIVGFKLGYGWLYVAAGLIVSGVGGFFGWKWWQKRKGK